MDVDAGEPSLRQLFSTDTPDILAELESIQRLHSISAQELFYKWESFCMKMGAEETKLTLDNVRTLKRDIQEALDRESKARHHLRAEKGHGHSSAARNRMGAGVDVFGLLDDIVPTTPSSSAKLQQQQSLSKRKSPFQTPSRAGKSPKFPTQPSRLQESSPLGPMSSPATRSTPFHKRRNPGEILEILNVQLPRGDSPMVPFSEPRIRPTANTDLKKFGYRPMAMRLSANSEVLDDKIDEFLEDIHKAAAAGTIKVDPGEIGNAAQCSPREIVAVGMIACDSPEGKLNPASLMLEMSRRTGAGLRVPLKVLDLTRIQFFPGQIVALRGNNPTGEYFNVASVINPPLLPPAASPPQTFQEINERVNGADGANEGIPLNYLIASGPYTADDNLDFEPLHAICEKAAEQKVDSLILLGPFLDLEHPLIAAGDIELPPIKGVDPDKVNMHTLFKYMIAAPIVKLTQEVPSITIIMCPSVRDVTSKHVSWPQEGMSRKELGLPKQVRMVSNPVTVSLNEVIFGLSSLDVLIELRNEETTGGRPIDNDPLRRLAKYIVEQRHFYPLFPGSPRSALPRTGTPDSAPMGAMVDLGFARLGDWWNVRPDVLITPSTLPPFVKVIDSVVVINPGHLSKKKSAGTYAQMWLHPRQLSEEEKQKNRVAHNVFERARLDILRI